MRLSFYSPPVHIQSLLIQPGGRPYRISMPCYQGQSRGQSGHHNGTSNAPRIPGRSYHPFWVIYVLSAAAYKGKGKTPTQGGTQWAPNVTG
jgi:hypothetical protein